MPRRNKWRKRKELYEEPTWPNWADSPAASDYEEPTSFTPAAASGHEEPTSFAPVFHRERNDNGLENMMSISAMPGFRHRSVEELRVADWNLDRQLKAAEALETERLQALRLNDSEGDAASTQKKEGLSGIPGSPPTAGPSNKATGPLAAVPSGQVGPSPPVFKGTEIGGPGIAGTTSGTASTNVEDRKPTSPSSNLGFARFNLPEGYLSLVPPKLGTGTSKSDQAGAAVVSPAPVPALVPPVPMPAVAPPVVPPAPVPALVPPASVPTVVPPASVPAVVPPASVPAVVPPAPVPAVVPPVPMPVVVPPVVPPAPMPAVVPPASVPAVVPPAPVQAVVPPTLVPAVVPPTPVLAPTADSAPQGHNAPQPSGLGNQADTSPITFPLCPAAEQNSTVADAEKEWVHASRQAHETKAQLAKAQAAHDQAIMMEKLKFKAYYEARNKADE